MSSESVKAPIALPDLGIVFAVGEIDEEMTARLVLGLEAIEAGKPIRVLISSEGGHVFDGMSIANAIHAARRRGSVVTAEVRGYCCSSAVYLLFACDTRTMWHDAWLGVHGMSSGMGGDQRDLDSEYAFNRRLVEQQAKLYTEKSFLTEEHWMSALQDKVVHYFSAAEALVAGLVDEVL